MPKNTEIDSSSTIDLAAIVPKIARFCDEWNDAEKWIKDGELVNQSAVTPSINELRYAGRRLVDACVAARDGDARVAETHLSEAGENLAKARHDVADAVIGYISGYANDVRERVGAGALKRHFSGYEKLFGALKNAAGKITESREDRRRRNEIYRGIMREDLPVLRELHDSLEASLPAIEENVKKDARQNRLYLIFGVAGIIIGVAGIVFQ